MHLPFPPDLVICSSSMPPPPLAQLDRKNVRPAHWENPGPTVPIPSEVKMLEVKIVDNTTYEKSCWIERVNRKFRHLENVAAYRNLRFNYPAFPMIEGAEFDPLINQMTVVANHSEVWLTSSVAGIHSAHSHLMWFLILARRSVVVGAEDEKDFSTGWEMTPREQQWFQDTLLLEPGIQFLVWAFPFADKTINPKLRATGKAMFHCHQTEHSDLGMMLRMLVSTEVDEKGKPVKPSGVGLLSGPQSKKIVSIVKKSSYPFK